jgi:hypothetical protein
LGFGVFVLADARARVVCFSVWMVAWSLLAAVVCRGER